MTDVSNDPRKRYWETVAGAYQSSVVLSTEDFHFGPLLPGNRDLELLPQPLKGKRCLEIGAGAGQNSLYLASEGAECIATDIAHAQLDHGRCLARDLGRDVTFLQADIDALPVEELGTFDLVHSAFALPFSHNPAAALQSIARLLRPGGHLLLVTAHPVYAGEWVDLDEGEEGLFLPDYFHPPADARLLDEEDEDPIISRAHPISVVTDWVGQAGLTLERLAEPRPHDLPSMAKEERLRAAPYYAEDWMALWPVLHRIPLVLVVLARRPPDPASS